MGHLWLLLLALFLMGTHSTFFGPIKYAILPEILKPHELMSGNALFQSGTSMAILFGMILGGAVIASSDGNLLWISITVVAIACIGYLFSRFILPQKVAAPDLDIDWNFIRTSFQTIKYAKSLPLVFTILLGNSWYWFYGATYLTQIPQLTQQNLHASENVVSLLLTFFQSVLVWVLFFAVKLVVQKLILKWCRLVQLALLFCALPCCQFSFCTRKNGALLTLKDVFTQGWVYYHVMIAVTLLGISGGFILFPYMP